MRGSSMSALPPKAGMPIRAASSVMSELLAILLVSSITGGSGLPLSATSGLLALY